MNHWDAVCQFCFKYTVKILRTPLANKAVRVGQLGENANFVAVFKLYAYSNKCLDKPNADRLQKKFTYG